VAARDLGYRPLVAEAELRVAAVLERKGEFEGAEQTLLEAILAAESSHHEEVAAEAWIKLVWVTGVERIDTEQGHVWGRFARAALDRLGRAELLDAMLTHNLGGVLYRERRLDEALAHYRKALVQQKKLLGPDDPVVGTTLNHIGNTLIELGRYSMARDYCERSYALRRRTLGERHPKVAASLNNIGELLRKQEEPEQSLEFARRSLEIVGGTAGPEEVVALVLEGIALTQLQRWDDAVQTYERMVELRARTDGPDDPRTATSLASLAEAQRRAGRLDEALATYERALALHRSARRHTDVARGMLGRARVLAARGDTETARVHVAEAIVEARRADDPDTDLLAALEGEPLAQP
jgi:tetratricopeptide (TPR) repeat protein